MPIDPLRQKQLFEQALARPPSERAAFLEEACGDDHELRGRVEALLESLAAADDFLAEPPAPSATGANEKPGGIIGRYKLLEQIGEGGFGVVWMAEQQEPVRRKVALKVIKLGMDTRQVVARFEAERQALALMEHPNIAKVFDGGITPGGRPYFVMELIKGVPITEYCDQAELDTPQRLKLFQQVCNAVQHAHQKGVIHRDLKPNNILVTLHDGAPVPKVIDFGIAKATSAELTQKTFFTEFRQMVGTPEYMAPEQAELSGLDVDTRADVYALGVVLYEMLTGTRPFDAQLLLEKGYLEMLRVIREDAPQRPSTRISTLGDQLAAAARRRHATPASLGRLMRGDLDWIVMKALEKERGRRYVTANGFSADIGRYLQDEPVLACPPSAAYRLRKYVRRHRLGVFASTAVALSLVAGLVATIWGWREAEAQRVRAVTAESEAIVERDAVKASHDFVSRMIGSANPAENKGRHYTVRQLLDDFDHGLGPALAGQPEVEASVRQMMASSYQGLGLYDQAASNAEAALAICLRVRGDEHPTVARSLNLLGSVRLGQGRVKEAEALCRQALAMSRRLVGNQDPSVAEGLHGLSAVLVAQGNLEEAESAAVEALAIDRELSGGRYLRVAADLGNLSWILQSLGRLSEAEKMLREALSMNREFHGDGHPSVALSLHRLAWTLQEAGEFAAAEPLAREALAMRRKLYGNEHPEIVNSLSNLAGCLQKLGKLEEAEAMYREELAMDRKCHGHEHPSVAVSLGNLGTVLMDQGKLAEAGPILREAVAMNRKSLGESLSVAVSLNNLSNVLLFEGKLAEAEAMQREALAMRRKFLGKEHSSVATGLSNLARILARQGKLADAEAMYRESLAMNRKLLGDVHPNVATLLNNLGDILATQGKLAEAEPRLRRSLAMWRKLFGGEHPKVALALNNLGKLLTRQGKFEEAEAMFRASLAMNRKLLGDKHSSIVAVLVFLAEPLAKQGKFTEAERAYRKSIALLRRQLGAEHPSVAKVLLRLGGLLQVSGKHTEAERVFRECLGILVKKLPDLWVRYCAMSQLGGALLGQGKYAEAEPLLLEGYEKMQPPPRAASRKIDALKLVVKLYESWGKQDKAAAWRAKLEAAGAGRK